MTAANFTILAIDLGKYKSVACLYDPATAHPRFDTFSTSRSELQKLFQRCPPAVVVIEACALAGWVHDLCTQLGVPCKVANTASEAWKFKHAKRKTDKDDAPAPRPARSAGSAADRHHPAEANPRMACPDCLPPDPGRPARRPAKPYPLDPGWPGSASAAWPPSEVGLFVRFG